MATIQSLTSTEIDERLAEDVPPLSEVLYVNPLTGNDSNTGQKWGQAFATLAAAIAAAPDGSMILLAAVGHDVGAGITVPATKRLTISGIHPLARRQHAGPDSIQACLYSSLSGSNRPSAFIKITASSGENIYGWTFQHVYVDGNSLLPGGAAIEAHAVNRAIVRDVAGRCLDESGLTIANGGDERYLVKTDAVGVGVDDASWWRMEDCFVNSMRLAHATSANYWRFPGCSATALTSQTPMAPGPAIFLSSGSCPDLSGVHIEGYEVGAQLTDCRNPIVVGLATESLTTSVHLTRCSEALVSVRSYGGTGDGRIVDEDGVDNIFIGQQTVTQVGNTYRQHRWWSGRGTSPEQPASGFISPIYATDSFIQNPAAEVWPSPFGNQDFALFGIAADYWNGSSWVAWLNANQCEPLLTADASAITIDATHKRCRFRIWAGGGPAPTRVMATLFQLAGGSDTTITVRYLDSGSNTIAGSQMTTVYDRPAFSRGFIASMEQRNAEYLEIEMNISITGAQTATITRLAAFGPGDAMSGAIYQGGRFTFGRVSPSGVIAGKAGDQHFAVGTGSNIADIGLWVNTLGGTTGWSHAMLEGPGPSGGDDLAMLNAALAAFPAEGGTLHLQRGTYLLSNTLEVPNKVTVRGQGRSVTMLKAHSTFGTNKPLVRLGPAADMCFASRLEHLWVQCDARSGSIGVYSFSAQEMTGLDYVGISEFKDTGVYFPGNCADYAISNLEIYPETGGANYGIRITPAGSVMVSQVTVGVQGPLTAGVYVNGGSGACSLTSIHVENCTDGILVNGSVSVSINGASSSIGVANVTNLVRMMNDCEFVTCMNLTRNLATHTIQDDFRSRTSNSDWIQLAVLGYADITHLRHRGPLLGFYNTTPVEKITVTGAKGGNEALGNLLQTLASLGLITNSTT